jgi:RNA polymerase sigma-70 factor (family 1)
MTHHEQDLAVALFNQGDDKAFTALYHEFTRGLHSYAKHFLGSKEAAQDIVSETFYRLLKKRGNFDSSDKLYGFLRITAKNLCIDQLRHKEVVSRNMDEIVESMSKPSDDCWTLDRLTEIYLSHIHQVIENLPRRSREVMKLWYIDELKNPEIARRLGTSEKTVRNQKSNALKRLRMKVMDLVKRLS